MSKALLQWVIAITGGLAIAMTVEGGAWLKWGVLVGLIGQPAWIWTTARERQWGMFALSIWYAGVFARGVVREWF